MDLLNTLKKFKNIKPDKNYAASSRSLILNAGREAKFNVWRLILRNVELGATFALAGILILLMLGGFSPWENIVPLQISNLDPSGLKAEANAIDIQIQLMNLNYGEALGAKSAESTLQSSVVAPRVNPPTQNESVSASGNASTSNAISIDEALQKLSE